VVVVGATAVEVLAWSMMPSSLELPHTPLTVTRRRLVAAPVVLAAEVWACLMMPSSLEPPHTPRTVTRKRGLVVPVAGRLLGLVCLIP
jgi:hypothetical protein